MAFLRNLLATLTGLIIFFVVAISILFGLIAVASSDDVPKIEANSVLSLKMSGILVEKAIEDPFWKAISAVPPQLSLLDIITSIGEAKYDDRIRGIYIEPRYLVAGYASLQEIRDAIINFKESGKFVYAYGEYISESDFYVASVADSIFVNPAGFLEFNGLGVNVSFYKGLFEKLEIKPEVFRVGEFKSYVEPYIRKNMSDENRLQYSALLNSVYDTYLENVSRSLEKETLELSRISDLMEVRLPGDAEKLGLIHKVGYEDELVSVMKSKLGLEEKDPLRIISAKKYARAIAQEAEYSRNKIAVIVAQGDIVMSGDKGIVGEKFAEEIRKARNNKSVKAIVMRINSGGGSMTASDMIWRELVLTRDVKPIIASMSNTAASGGYYIAMPCDTIVAQPNTITGSIGIFGLWYNLTNFLENKLGITHDVVKTGEFSDIFTVTRELTSYERQIIQSMIEDGYETFTRKAAEHRGMTQDELKEIASGRVWSGKQALENGLVDVLGSFNDAVELAAEAAGIKDDYRLRYYPQQKSFIEEFIDKMTAAIRIQLMGEEMTPLKEKLDKLKHLQGVQARLPGELKIQ